MPKKVRSPALLVSDLSSCITYRYNHSRQLFATSMMSRAPCSHALLISSKDYLYIMACHDCRVGITDWIHRSAPSHSASAMDALAELDDRLEFAKLVGARYFHWHHEVQHVASGPR
jgi:hypothetical protein